MPGVKDKLSKLPKKWRIRAMVLATLAVIIIVLLIITTSYINEPSVGTVKSGQALTNSSAVTFNMTPTQFSGPYMSFNYPKALNSYPASKPVGQVLANYDFINRTEEQWFLAIAVLNIPGGNISDDNSYQVRQLNPQQYKASVIKVNGQDINVMTDVTAAGFSEVAFLANNNYQATIALTANSSSDPNLDKSLDMVLSSWQWR